LALEPSTIAARLEALDRYLRLLAEEAKTEAALFINDPRHYGYAERFLQLAIEAVFDIGSHCLAAVGLARPASYGEILPSLVKAQIISESTAVGLTSMAGFRNVLVYDYLAIDHKLVHDFLNSRLESIRRFAAEVAAKADAASDPATSP
jgi:uncharacterized protein YutE (UPF0331/DUF86 family)